VLLVVITSVPALNPGLFDGIDDVVAGGQLAAGKADVEQVDVTVFSQDITTRELDALAAIIADQESGLGFTGFAEQASHRHLPFHERLDGSDDGLPGGGRDGHGVKGGKNHVVPLVVWRSAECDALAILDDGLVKGL